MLMCCTQHDSRAARHLHERRWQRCQLRHPPAVQLRVGVRGAHSRPRLARVAMLISHVIMAACHLLPPDHGYPTSSALASVRPATPPPAIRILMSALRLRISLEAGSKNGHCSKICDAHSEGSSCGSKERPRPQQHQLAADT